MLPKSYRLRKRSARERVRRSRAVFRGPHLALRVLQRHDALPPRVVIAVSRRVSQRAVDRNRVTRLLREALRRQLPRLTSGVDLSVSATAPVTEYRFTQCVAEIEALLKRARLLTRERLHSPT